jgi:hypothetical protein
VDGSCSGSYSMKTALIMLNFSVPLPERQSPNNNNNNNYNNNNNNNNNAST